ncbi:glutaredoxin [Plectosphaerella cucumerina]|jgi:glutaredoxin|uniref:Glutaredoxin n=1 Tax=Plectosphaerella cucumerina TaxID=40658 RepID=A0A8K0TCY4_9PEZI|nr:glutaredoxin [Plectosphaerella cucumerina]
MPSVRQIRTLAVGVLIGVVFILFYTSRLGNDDGHRNKLDFWDRTVEGLDKNQQALPYNGAKDKDGDGNIDADDELLAKQMSERLKAAEEQAKEAANKKAPRPDAPSKVVGQGNSAAHQGDAAAAADTPAPAAAAADSEDPAAVQRRAVEAELNGILKRSPVIIFSKSYCPFSKRAKTLLLEKYNITPAPFVVELDEHDLGKPLQAYLGEKTDRTTVPNILVNGVSIGGSDDIAELDAASKLVSKIVDLGAGRVKMRARPKTA